MDILNGLRIPPIAHQDWTQEVRDILALFSEQLAQLGSSGNENEKDNLSLILSTLLQHPPLAKAFLPFGRYLLVDSTLDERCRELIILRVTWLWRCEYEWAHHSMSALGSRLFSEVEVERVKQPVLSLAESEWREQEALLLLAVDELRECSNIKTETWQALSRHYSRQQLMDIVFTVGGYALSGMFMNAFGIPLKEDMHGFD